MTILGRHTVQEVLDYIKSQDWRFEKYNEAYKRIPTQYRSTHADIMRDLDRDWSAIYKKWKETANAVGYSLKAQMLAVPFYVSANNVPAESEWQQAIKIWEDSKNGPLNMLGFVSGSQRDCEERISIILGTATGNGQVDIDSNRPLQNAPDTDIAIIKELDAATKAGEQAAAEVGKKAGSIAKSNIGLMALGGIALVGAGVVAAKVYL